MAFYRKLTEGWRLTDGILPESLMEKPMNVYDALREAGRIPDAEMSLNAMECEWISLREWTYSLLLDTPGEDDERVYIELPKCAGTGKAYLNGEMIGTLYSGAVRLDATGAMKDEGENRLELKFHPRHHARPGMSRPLPETGLPCAPVMRTVNFALVERMNVSSRMDGRDGIIEIELHIDAFTGGKYLFAYGVMLDGETVGRFEFPEKLKAAKRVVKHEIRIKDALYFEPERLEETIYSVKFTLERGGVGCDVRHTETAFRKSAPLKCMAVRTWPVTGDLIDRLLEAGADGIVMTGQPEDAFEKNDFLAGLTVVPDGERIDSVGMLTAQEMERYASGEAFWPMNSPAWKLRGGCAPENGETYGAEAEKYAKAVRFLQAQRVKLSGLDKRRKGEKAIVQADEDFAYFAGSALIEKSGGERPALSLLKEAWNGARVYCELPEGGMAQCDRLLQMNVWALTEGLRGSILTASVKIMDGQGNKLAEERFPVMGGEARLAGSVEIRTPETEGILIVRSELKNDQGGVICGADDVLVIGSEPALKILLAAEETKLNSRFAGIRNEGAYAAVSAGKALLPGEETEKTGAEWINA